jgi:hypothetical protein
MAGTFDSDIRYISVIVMRWMGTQTEPAAQRERQPLARVWEVPVADPNLHEPDSLELTARSASRLDAGLGAFLNWALPTLA